MRDLYNRLIEIPEGDVITILRVALENKKLQVHCESELNFQPIVQALVSNIDLSKVAEGLLLDLFVDIDEKGVNVTNCMEKSISHPSILEEIENLRKNINEKFAKVAGLLDQDPLFEETTFKFIFEKVEDTYVYNSFVRPLTSISEHKALIRKLTETPIFEEVTEIANNTFENEQTVLVQFKSNGVTLEDIEFGVYPDR